MWNLLAKNRVTFGVVEGNGSTQFATSFETTEQLLQMVKEFFKPPKRDLHGLANANEATACGDEEYTSDDDDAIEVQGDNEISPRL